MAEEVTGQSWEELMGRIVFDPLKMRTAGFGSMGTPGKIDQPWQHAAADHFIPKNGPDTNITPVWGPCGASPLLNRRLGKICLRSASGARRQRRSHSRVHTYEGDPLPAFDSVTNDGARMGSPETRSLEQGGPFTLIQVAMKQILSIIVWVAPAEDFAVLICTNEGGPQMREVCEKAGGNVIRLQIAASRQKI